MALLRQTQLTGVPPNVYVTYTINVQVKRFRIII